MLAARILVTAPASRLPTIRNPDAKISPVQGRRRCLLLHGRPRRPVERPPRPGGGPAAHGLPKRRSPPPFRDHRDLHSSGSHPRAVEAARRRRGLFSPLEFHQVRFLARSPTRSRALAQQTCKTRQGHLAVAATGTTSFATTTISLGTLTTFISIRFGMASCRGYRLGRTAAFISTSPAETCPMTGVAISANSPQRLGNNALQGAHARTAVNRDPHRRPPRAHMTRRTRGPALRTCPSYDAAAVTSANSRYVWGNSAL